MADDSKRLLPSSVQYLIVHVEDVRKAAETYAKLFGFTYKASDEMPDFIHLNALSKGGLAIGLHKAGKDTDSAPGASSLSYVVADLEQYHSAVIEKNDTLVKVTKPPTREPWGGYLANYVLLPENIPFSVMQQQEWGQHEEAEEGEKEEAETEEKGKGKGKGKAAAKKGQAKAKGAQTKSQKEDEANEDQEKGEGEEAEEEDKDQPKKGQKRAAKTETKKAPGKKTKKEDKEESGDAMEEDKEESKEDTKQKKGAASKKGGSPKKEPAKPQRANPARGGSKKK